MPPRTIFLSRLLGLYSLIVALAMLANKAAYVAKVDALIHNPPLLLLTAIFALAVGLAVILTHNVWSGGALAVVVTLVGWGSLVKGVIFLFLSPDAAVAYFEALHYGHLYYVFTGVTLLLGAYLTYGGFKSLSR